MTQHQDRERQSRQCSALVIAPEGQMPRLFCRRTGISGKDSTDSLMLAVCPFNTQQPTPQVTDCTRVR